MRPLRTGLCVVRALWYVGGATVGAGGQCVICVGGALSPTYVAIVAVPWWHSMACADGQDVSLALAAEHKGPLERTQVPQAHSSSRARAQLGVVGLNKGALPLGLLGVLCLNSTTCSPQISCRSANWRWRWPAIWRVRFGLGRVRYVLCCWHACTQGRSRVAPCCICRWPGPT